MKSNRLDFNEIFVTGTFSQDQNSKIEYKPKDGGRVETGRTEICRTCKEVIDGQTDGRNVGVKQDLEKL